MMALFDALDMVDGQLNDRHDWWLGMVDGLLHGRIWWRVHKERSRLRVERGVGEVARELVHSNVHLSI